MYVYQQFDVDIVPSTCSSIKYETPAQLFSCEFWEIFQSASLLKTRPCHRGFPVSFANIFKSTYFAEHLRSGTSLEDHR